MLLASDQAVMLYLDGLDIDIEDAEAALAHVLQRQLDDHRFDAAVRTAAQAERTSVGMSAMLTDLLDATSRDVRSHDWLVDVPGRLTRARRHVEGRIGEDDRFLEHVQAGLDGDASPDVRAASGQIGDLLRRAKRVHLDLERRLLDAREVFLAAQVRQRLAPRRRLRLLSLSSELFTPVLTLPADKNYFGAAFEATMADAGITRLRPARKGEPERAGAPFFKPLRQIIESINDTFKGQLDLEQHGGHTAGGVAVRVLQRILALTAAIWHNDQAG